MSTFWERAAHSVYLCSLCILTYCSLSYFPLWTLVMIASVPGHFLSFTFTFEMEVSLFHFNILVVF